MKFLHFKTDKEMSDEAARLVEACMAEKPNLVLGLATGSTPEGLYAALCRDYAAGKVDFSAATTVNLDEYCGLPADHSQSYITYMREKLFNHVNLNPARTHLPNGCAKDPDAEAERYEQLLASLGYPDLQILGIGRNGHIGFNEPADTLFVKTHVTALTEDTIRANSRFFTSVSDVPRRALTMGVGSIMAARRILLLACGAEKRSALTALKSGVVDTNCPVTLLQLHPDVTVLCDEAAYPGGD